jgi:hypothetical protein
MGRRVAVMAIACAGALAMACATGGKGSSAGPSATAANADGSGTSSRDAVAGEDLMNTAATNLYDALHAVRPEMLTGHGLGAPDVYIRDMREPKGVERLREIAVNQVQSVRYLKPEDARSLSGQQSEGGALVVTLR